MPESDPFRSRLLGEIDAWRREGIVSVEQAAVLRNRYIGPTGEAPQDTGRLITTLAVLGSILVGVGVILFVASNWDRLLRPARVLLLFSVTFATYYAGWHQAYGTAKYPRVGRSLLFLGTLFFGGSVMLIGQMYHVNANDPGLVLLWLAGVAPLAYAFRSIVIAAESMLLLALWLALQLVEWREPYNLAPEAIVAVYMALGFAAYAVGVNHARFPDFARLGKAYLLLGLVSAAAAMYVVTFGDYARNADWEPLQQGPMLAVIAVLIGVGAAGGVSALLDREPLRQAAVGRLAPFETGALLGGTGLTLAFFFIPDMFTNALLFNLILGAFIVGVILLGYARRDTTIFNLGLLFFVIDVMTRYFDFFWDYLDRSVAFIGAGLLLLGGGYFLERKRRELVQRMTDEQGGA